MTQEYTKWRLKYNLRHTSKWYLFNEKDEHLATINREDIANFVVEAPRLYEACKEVFKYTCGRQDGISKRLRIVVEQAIATVGEQGVMARCEVTTTTGRQCKRKATHRKLGVSHCPQHHKTHQDFAWGKQGKQ